MSLASVPALIIALLFVLPGVTYQVVRTRLQGPRAEEQDNTSRLMRALAVSTVLIGVYAIAAGPALLGLLDTSGDISRPEVRANSRVVAALGLTLLVGIPAGLAIVEDRLVRRKERDQARYDPTPTAWQWATKRAFNRPGFVRVLTEKDVWVGGYYAEDSYATGFPHPPSLFVQRGYYMNDEGAFLGPKADSRGVWVRCDNATVVEFLDDTSVTKPNDTD